MGGFEHLGQINQFDKGKTVPPFKMKCFLSADTVSGPDGGVPPPLSALKRRWNPMCEEGRQTPWFPRGWLYTPE